MRSLHWFLLLLLFILVLVLVNGFFNIQPWHLVMCMQSGKGREREMELMAILDRTGSNGGPGEGPDNHIDEVQIGNGKYF